MKSIYLFVFVVVVLNLDCLATQEFDTKIITFKEKLFDDEYKSKSDALRTNIEIIRDFLGLPYNEQADYVGKYAYHNDMAFVDNLIFWLADPDVFFSVRSLMPEAKNLTEKEKDFLNKRADLKNLAAEKHVKAMMENEVFKKEYISYILDYVWTKDTYHNAVLVNSRAEDIKKYFEEDEYYWWCLREFLILAHLTEWKYEITLGNAKSSFGKWWLWLEKNKNNKDIYKYNKSNFFNKKIYQETLDEKFLKNLIYSM